MRSIDGFNNGSAGSFGQGNSSASGLNKLGTGIDIAKTGMSSEVTFQSSTGGTSYSTPIQAYDYNWKFNQFDVFVEKWNDPNNPEAEPEYRVRCVQGLTTFRNFRVDENGFITQPEFVWNRRIQKWNVYPTGSLVFDENGTDEYFISGGDYVKIEKDKNYKVFLYKISPTVDYYDASLCPQIAIIEEGSPADENVKSSFSGGGVMQSYIVSESTTVENIVTADPLSGKIATFDAAELNDAIKLNLDLLDIVRSGGQGANHPDQYPPSLSAVFGDYIPTFLNKSTNPFTCISFDGDSISGVPYGINWYQGNEGGGSYVTVLTSSGGMTSNYANAGDELNCAADNVIIGRDISGYFTPPIVVNNLVTGLINPNDFTIVSHDDAPPADIVYFDNTDIDIIASSQSSVTAATVEVPTGKPVGNVGFKYFDCARKELAYIKWVKPDPAHPEIKVAERFDVYQINNGPIVFQDEPLLLDVKKVQTQADAHWGGDSDPEVAITPQITEIYYWGDYESDYSKSKYRDNSNHIGGYLPEFPTRTSG